MEGGGGGLDPTYRHGRGPRGGRGSREQEDPSSSEQEEEEGTDDEQKIGPADRLRLVPSKDRHNRTVINYIFPKIQKIPVLGFSHRLNIDCQCTIHYPAYMKNIQTAITHSVCEIS